MYLLQADLGILKYNYLPKGTIQATLRLGTNFTNGTTQISENMQEKDLAIKLQLQSETSPQIQRCSVTLSFQDSRILGVAIISVPKTTNEINTFSKLIQCVDKKAQLFLKLKVSKMDNEMLQNQSKLKELHKVIQRGNISPIKRRQSLNNPRTSLKSQSSFEYDIQQAPNILQSSKNALKTTRQSAQQQIKKLKQEKDIYYQLYRIQKSKSEVAATFISSLISKLTNQYPQLLTCFIDQAFSPLKKKSSTPKNDNEEIVNHLKQANNGLHRQIQQYKKVIQQLKAQLFKNSEQSTKREPSQAISLMFPRRPSILQKSEKVLPALKKQKERSLFQSIDFKRWLQDSMQQRLELQQILKQMPQHPNDQQLTDKKKLKSKIDKSFQTLLSKQPLNRMSVIIHKREVAKILDQFCI